MSTIYLYNYYDHDELPSPDIYSQRGKGINISSTKLTREVVEICHKNNKLVGVWIDREIFSENEEFYHHIINMGSISFVAIILKMSNVCYQGSAKKKSEYTLKK